MYAIKRLIKYPGHLHIILHLSLALSFLEFLGHFLPALVPLNSNFKLLIFQDSQTGEFCLSSIMHNPLLVQIRACLQAKRHMNANTLSAVCLLKDLPPLQPLPVLDHYTVLLDVVSSALTKHTCF